MPIGCDKLRELKSASQWSIATAREYLSFQKSDPWVGYWNTRQTLTAAMKRLGYRPPSPRSGNRNRGYHPSTPPV